MNSHPISPEPALARTQVPALVLYFLSGACGLVVEQIFERLVTTVIGTSVEAAAIVLSVYFVALSVGALGYAPLARRVLSPLRLYGAAEVFAGVCAIVIGLSFSRIQIVSVSILQSAGESSIMLPLARVFVAALFIGPPAFAMGTTFPAMVAFAEKQEDSNRLITRMYACNVGGGVVAALGCPYGVFPTMGMTGAALLVGAIQLSIGMAAIAVARRIAKEDVARTVVDWRPLRVIFVLAFLSGAITFGWEVLWVQLIGATIGMSVYAFSTMLGIVLIGLFVGGALISMLPARVPAALTMGAAFLLSGVVCALVFPRWPEVPDSLVERARYAVTFPAGEWVRFQEAALMLGPPAVALGLVYPSLLRAIPKEGASRVAAWLGVVSAVGSCTGAMLTAHVFIPRLHSEGTYRLLSYASAGVGVLLMVRVLVLGKSVTDGRLSGGPIRAVLGVAVGVVVILGGVSLRKPWDILKLTSGKHVYFRSAFVHPDVSSLKFLHEDAIGGITTVVENRVKDQSGKVLLTNGKFQGSDSGETTAQASFGILPLLAVKNHARAAVIGLGTGHSASVFTRTGFERVDVIELAPGMIAAANAEFAELNKHALTAPNVNVYIEDGRNRLLRDKEARYDIISIEISSIWFVGATNLYSREFYELAKTRLAPDGVLQQWVQLHHSAPQDFLSVVRTVRTAFPHVGVWYVGGQGIILASAVPITFTPEVSAKLRATPGLQDEFRALGTLDVDALARTPFWPMTRENDIDRVADAFHAPVNTDANRFLEYSSPRYNLGSRFAPDGLINVVRKELGEPEWKAP